MGAEYACATLACRCEGAEGVGAGRDMRKSPPVRAGRRWAAGVGMTGMCVYVCVTPNHFKISKRSLSYIPSLQQVDSVCVCVCVLCKTCSDMCACACTLELSTHCSHPCVRVCTLADTRNWCLHIGVNHALVFSHCYLDETCGKSSLCIFKDINAHQGHKCTAGFLWLVHQLLVSGNTAFHAAQVNADVG